MTRTTMTARTIQPDMEKRPEGHNEGGQSR
jgi:hypothetical protein